MVAIWAVNTNRKWSHNHANLINTKTVSIFIFRNKRTRSESINTSLLINNTNYVESLRMILLKTSSIFSWLQNPLHNPSSLFTWHNFMQIWTKSTQILTSKTLIKMKTYPSSSMVSISISLKKLQTKLSLEKMFRSLTFTRMRRR